MKSFSLPAIEYTPKAKACNESVSFADRIMKEAMQSPAREAFNSMKKEYDWQVEGSSKRFIR